MICTLVIAFAPLTGASCGDTPAEQADAAARPTLYTVGYAHLDTQWRWDYPLTIREYIPSTLKTNFALFEKYPDYVFNFSGANRYRMIREYYPADYEKLKEYIAAGRWFPCGSSMEECDVNTTSAESIIRQVLYGNHYFRSEFSKASEEFMLPDCFGFPASLPSLLAHCGLKGFSTQKLSWGSAVGIPFNVGVWEGLDGRYVIAALNPGSYGGQVEEDLSQSAGWLKRIDEDGKKSGVYKDYMYYGTGDIGGSPTEDSVKWIEKSVAGEGPVRVLSTPADQLFLDIKPEAVKDLPRFQGDMLLTEHSAGSITSQAYMKRWNHKNELLADSAERAAVAASWLKGMVYPQQKLNDAWTLVMGGQFHDILPGTSLPKAYEYSQNDEVLALNHFADVLDSAVGTVASGLDTRGKGMAVVVYNPLAVEREDVVEATLAAEPKNKLGAVRVTGPDGREVPSQLVSAGHGEVKVLFLARVQSVGFAVYDVQAAESAGDADIGLSVSGTGLENQRYRVNLNADGDVASIFDKAAQRELLSAPARLAFTHDHPGYWPAWNIDWADQQKPPRGYVGGPSQVRVVENGPVRVTLEVTREAEGSRFVQRISLAAGGAGDRVEVRNTIDWRGRECNLKAEFPLSVSNPYATYNWEVGKVRRLTNDPKKYEVPSHQWFDLTDENGDYGVTVLAPYKYGSDKPDDRTLRLTLLRTPGTPGNDYADQGCQDWGRHDITYGLAGHKSDWRAGQADWQAMRLEQPLVAFQSGQHEGALGKELSLVSVSSPRVRLMALKQAEDGTEIIARLVELNGVNSKDVKVSFAAAVVAAREVDGQERQLGEARVANGKLVVDFAPYALRTFAIKLAWPKDTVEPSGKALMVLQYDASVASRDGEAVTSGFDADGRCLAAEMLPEVIVDSAAVFKLGPVGEGMPNALTCRGQGIALPASIWSRVYLLAAADGDQTADFVVDGTAHSLTIQDWGGYIGQWDTRLWKGDIPEEAFVWTWELAGLAPGYVKRAPVAWFCSHRHSAGGDNEPYSYSYLYRYAIDIPAGAKELKLPDNAKIRILAVSVAHVADRDWQPAQPLYDTLQGARPTELTLSR